MKRYFLPFSFFLLFGALVYGSNSVTIQPNSAVGLDSLIYSGSPITNFASGASFYIGDGWDGSSNADRVLIKFSGITTAVPAGSTVRSATLSLYESGAVQSSAPTVPWHINLYKVLQPWVSSQVTWTIYSTGNNWDSAGCSTDGTDYDSTVLATLAFDATPASAFVDFTGDGLTSYVQAIIDGGTDNGLLIRSPDAEFIGVAPFAVNTFASSDNTTAANRPKLTIVYDLSGSAPAPIGTYGATGIVGNPTSIGLSD